MVRIFSGLTPIFKLDVGRSMPWGWGIVHRDMYSMRYLIAPMPFHWLVRWLTAGYWWCVGTYLPGHYEWQLYNAYKRGFRAGVSYEKKKRDDAYEDAFWSLGE